MGCPPVAVDIGWLSTAEAAVPMRTAGASLRETASGVLVERGRETSGATIFGGGAGTGAWKTRAAVAMGYLLPNHGQRQSTAQRADRAQLAILTMHRRFQVH